MSERSLKHVVIVQIFNKHFDICWCFRFLCSPSQFFSHALSFSRRGLARLMLRNNETAHALQFDNQPSFFPKPRVLCSMAARGAKDPQTDRIRISADDSSRHRVGSRIADLTAVLYCRNSCLD